MISIIVPYYNSAKYIEKLLKSIENQTDNNYELIIINDYSKKEERDFLIKSLEKYNINYLYLENDRNLGVGQTRNKGMKYAKGEYIVFIDSDDWVDNNFVKKINQNLKNKKVDILFFDYYRIGKSKKKYYKTIKNKKNIDNMTKEEVLIYTTGNICGKAIKREVIIQNNLEFSELKRFEDWVFISQVILKSNKVSYLQEGLYYYYINTNSITQSKMENVCFYSKIGFEILKKELLKIESKEKMDVINILYLREVVYVAIKEYSSKEDFLKKMKYIYSEILVTKYRKILSFHQKLLVSLYEKKYYFIIKMLGKYFL